MKSPLKTIRDHCLDCSNGSSNEVSLCPCDKCKLWPYRFGKSVNRPKRELTEIQREKLRQTLARKNPSCDYEGFEQGGQISKGDAP